MRTFNNFYFSLRVIQYISFYFDQYCSCTLPMQKYHFVNAAVALYQCKSATSSMRKWHFIGAKLLRKPHVFGFLHQQLHEWLTLVSHTIVEHSVLQILLQLAHLPAWR